MLQRLGWRQRKSHYFKVFPWTTPIWHSGTGSSRWHHTSKSSYCQIKRHSVIHFQRRVSDGRELGSPAPPLWPWNHGESWHLSRPQLFQGDNKCCDQYINACTLLLVWDLGFHWCNCKFAPNKCSWSLVTASLNHITICPSGLWGLWQEQN